MAVFLADEQERVVNSDDLCRLARFTLRHQRVPEDMELSLLLVDVSAMAALNERHMGKPGPTDVLAFPMDEPGESPLAGPAILGDVVLCPDVAAEQGPRYGRSVHDELRLLTVHGILHLLGMDHADPQSEREMFGLTDVILSEYGQSEVHS
ncbi:MAG: rRNA maturation RNase YbeY [Actinobacteria bacterium]|nr:rRNA maturation RNase YbeY [Actinomycetota bacterium]